MPTRPASGWFATVTASGGHTHEVSILADGDRSVGYTPKANARPAIRLPAALSNKWAAILGDGSNDIDLDAWHDGNRVAIDTLDDVDETPGANVLVGSGGRELETRIEESIDQEAVHVAAERLIDNQTTYTSNVDTPTTSTETNTTLISLTSDSDWLSRTTNIIDTAPVTVSGGTINLSQTCFTLTATTDDTALNGVGQSNGHADYANTDRYNFDAVGEWVEWEFSPDYTIPGDDFDFPSRGEPDGADHVGLTWKLDINSTGSFFDIETMAAGGLSGGDLIWRSTGEHGTAGETPPDIPPGTHTVRIECTEAGADSWFVDAIAPRDSGDRYGGFNYTDSNSTDSNDDLAGPEFRPDEFQVKFLIVTAPEAVTGARAEATVDEGADDYTHYLSNDQGTTYASGTPTTSSGTSTDVEIDNLGTDFGPGITYKAGLSRTGTGATGTNGGPTEGRNGTDLQALTLKADLEDMPIVVNQAFDGSLASVLTQLANIGDQLWAYQRSGSTESIEWTTPGQRTTTKTLDPETYNVTKTVKDVYQQAAVYGQPDVTRSGERFQSDHGNAVGLAQDRIQFESEVVIDPDTGERYRRNEDYTMDYQAGEITVLAAGDMANSSTFEIDYDFQPFGEFDDGTADPDTIDVNIPGLTTDFACEQAAQLIVNEVNTPLWTAEIVLTKLDVNFSVVDSIDPDIVPTGGNELHVRSNPTNPTDPRLVLGSRRGVSDVVDDIRTQVGSVSRPT